jgi:hypothetical protein
MESRSKLPLCRPPRRRMVVALQVGQSVSSRISRAMAPRHCPAPAFPRKHRGQRFLGLGGRLISLPRDLAHFLVSVHPWVVGGGWLASAVTRWRYCEASLHEDAASVCAGSSVQRCTPLPQPICLERHSTTELRGVIVRLHTFLGEQLLRCHCSVPAGGSVPPCFPHASKRGVSAPVLLEPL